MKSVPLIIFGIEQLIAIAQIGHSIVLLMYTLILINAKTQLLNRGTIA